MQDEYGYQNSREFVEFLRTNDAIYHYTNLRKGVEGLLESFAFKPSCLAETDDPQEYKNWLFGSTGWGLPDDIASRHSEASAYCDKLIRFHSYILCFSAKKKSTHLDPETREAIDRSVLGYEKSRMWSQYGDHHCGICLVFSRKALLKEIRASVEGSVFAKRIRYRNLHELEFSATLLKANKLVGDDWRQYCLQHIKKNSDEIYFTKNFDYADESEFRILMLVSSDKKPTISMKSSLRGIILGDKLHKNYFLGLVEICRRNGVQGRRLIWSKGRPHLVKMVAEEPS